MTRVNQWSKLIQSGDRYTTTAKGSCFCFPLQVKDRLKRMGILQPLNIFLRQEIDRMQKVISVVRMDLTDLKLAIEGTIIMNEVSINSLGAKFCRGNINTYLHFMSLLHIDMTQVLKILPQVRAVSTYFTLSISRLLMSWRREEPGHQQPWYWPS